MPSAQDLERNWAAEFALHGGLPPGEQHAIKMLEDPAYRAAHTPGLSNDHGEGIVVGEIEFDRGRRKLITIFFGQLALRNDAGQIDGIATYDPKTGKEHFEFPPHLR